MVESGPSPWRRRARSFLCLRRSKRAILPEHEVRIVFTSGATVASQEYTSLTPLEELTDEELQEWYEGAIEGSGL